MSKHFLPRAALVFAAASLTSALSAGTFSLSETAVPAGVTAVQIPSFFPLAKGMLAGGAAGDFNRDGYQDIYVITGGSDVDRLYINNGDGTFTDQAASWGLLGAAYCAGVAVGDFNDDGWLDVFVTTHGAPGSGWAPGGHRLYRNNGDSTFTEMAAAAGVNTTSPFIGDGFGAAFGDYDLDGDLDLAVPGWVNGSQSNRLFRNNGDETFTDVTSSILYDMTNVRGFAVRFTDMDGDRYPELLWVADFFTSKYLKNNGDGTFTEMTAASGTGLDSNGMGTTIGDFNEDGLLDWYVTSIMHDGVPMVDGNKLYVNQGNHVYTEMALTVGVDDGGWGWGTVAIDIDHDTDLDIVETNGWNEPEWIGENSKLFINDGSMNFTESSALHGLSHVGYGRGLINLDIENDGDQDLVVFTNQDRPFIYRNDLSGAGTNWIRLFFDTSAHADLAPDGFGTRVWITAGGKTRVHMLDGGSNYLAVSELSVHFGLGAATNVEEILVEWTNGRINRFPNLAPNQTLTLEPCFTAGDVDGNRVVDFADLNLVLSGWGTSVTPWREGDADGDGDVDFDDINIVLAAWSMTCS